MNMDARERQERVGRVVFGLIAIGLGLLFMLDNLGRLEAGRFLGYWPLMLIGFGMPVLIAPKESGETAWGALLTGMGTFFLLRRFHLIRWSFWQLWPLFLVFVGLVLLAEGWWGPGRRSRGSAPENGGAR
jgi:cell wall-active antibiotic response 4TMS protein YvqF